MDLNHQFLLTMPQLRGDDFHESLIYILDHGEQGAFGVVVNHQLGMPLSEVFDQLDINPRDSLFGEEPVLRGGPVDQTHGLVLHPPGEIFDATRNFNDQVSLSSSRDILEALADGQGPQTHLILLGHAGWAPGQLEMEIAENAWLTAEADADIIFHTPIAEKRAAVGRQLGIDLANIVGQAGHA